MKGKILLNYTTNMESLGTGGARRGQGRGNGPISGGLAPFRDTFQIRKGASCV